MPSILNLKFKGNKSFVAFSNLGETDSLTKTWKVCTKVASFLEQGQRLENLSWRLWHLQNLMVDSDNAKSKREFKKLSKVMGDKLDKEKGRNIEDLSAPGFRRNPSTDMIQQRAVEKERNREASQNAKPGMIKRNMFTFSLDQSFLPQSAAPSKPDLKPSAEFGPGNKRSKNNTAPPMLPQTLPLAQSDVDMGTPLTQRGRKSSISTQGSEALSEWSNEAATLRFPSLFTSDFGPTALLNPAPTVRSSVSYGDGGSFTTAAQDHEQDSFAISRPTLELPLDDILSTLTGETDPFALLHSVDQDVVMHAAPSMHEGMMTYEQYEAPPTARSTESPPAIAPSALMPMSPPQLPVKDFASPAPKTVAPAKLGADRPRLTLKTPTSRSSHHPSASATVSTSKQASSAPGGVKGECSNCGATHTPLWRRGLNDELNCNACGLYCKLHKRPRPKSMRNSNGEGRASHAAASRAAAATVVSAEAPETPSASAGFSGRARSASAASVLASATSAQCYNCHTTTTPLWRKDDEGKTVCNACGLYFKLHGSARPISMKSDVIRKRSRHDARRAAGAIEQTPSDSPSASRRASPVNDNVSTPTFAPDSSTSQPSAYPDFDYPQSTASELMGALGGDSNQYSSHYSLSSFTPFPGPYHPDYLAKVVSAPADPLPFASADSGDDSQEDGRANKRRRMSNVSTVSSSGTEPPLSAASYGSYDSGFASSTSSLNGNGNNQSQARPPLEFPYASYSSYSLMRAANAASMWPTATRSPPTTFVHPPMLPPDEVNMDYMQHMPSNNNNNGTNGHPHEDEVHALFTSFLHPPMMLPDSPQHGLAALQPQQNCHSQVHPPMLPPDTYEFFGDVSQAAGF